MSYARKRTTKQPRRSDVRAKKAKIDELSESEAESSQNAPLSISVEVVLTSPAPRGRRQTVVTESGEKFAIVKPIAEGTFGKVYHVTDKKKKAWAMKLSKNCDDVAFFHDHEKNITDRIGRENHKNLMPLCTFGKLETKVEDCAQWMILMPLLGPSVREVMKRAAESMTGVIHSFPVEDIFNIGKQLLEAIEVLDTLGIAHLDLKPENMLFNNPNLNVKLKKVDDNTYHTVVNDLHIKLGDYGSTGVFTKGKTHFSEVQTRCYRAPEIFLGLPYTHTTDIWSVGCILTELYTGKILFNGPKSEPNRPSEIAQFFMMMAVLNKKPSRDQIAKASRSQKYLDILDNKSWEDEIGPFPLLMDNIRKGDTNYNVEHLFCVINYFLSFDPNSRPAAYLARRHL
ncbi:unnamed protein product [Caenorhabditis sp. 36 PRJEB53466]|nr:unnamed protein product [Caenorhabditis sp. 36 PRJEB53466]